jgi:hypothetical protein
MYICKPSPKYQFLQHDFTTTGELRSQGGEVDPPAGVNTHPGPPGPIPTTLSYNATSSLVRFEKKQYYLSTLKQRSSLLQRCRRSCKFGSRRLGSRSVPRSSSTMRGGMIFSRSNLAVFCFNFIFDFSSSSSSPFSNYSFLFTSLFTRLI